MMEVVEKHDNEEVIMLQELSVPTNSDWLFRRIFGDEENIASLQALLQAVLGLDSEDLAEISLLNPYTRQEHAGDKYGILDVKLKTAGGKVIDVEIQVARERYFQRRILFYLSKMVAEQMKKGDSYDVVKKAISVTILDHELLVGSGAYHHLFCLYDAKNDVSFGDILEVHTLELPKLPASPDGTKLWDWLAFFKSKDAHALERLAQSNEEVARVVGVYKELSVDEKELEAYRAREKAEMDYYAGMAGARNEGVVTGRVEVARNALSMGLDVATIAQMTGLDAEEIGRLSP